MKSINQPRRAFTYFNCLHLFALGFMLTACTIILPNQAPMIITQDQQPAVEAVTSVEIAPAGTPEESSIANATANDGASNGAIATVSTRSLRVRSGPSADAPMIGGIKEGETYQVIGLSSDGHWVQLVVSEIADGTGWVTANLVSVQGEITEIAITPVAESTVPDEEEITPDVEEPASTGSNSITTEDTLNATDSATDAAADSVPTAETSEVADSDSEASSTSGLLPTFIGVEATLGDDLSTPEPGTMVVGTEGELRLRIRNEPNTEGTIIGYAHRGEVYKVISRTRDGEWILIAGAEAGVESDNPDGGWVSAEFVILNDGQ